MTLGSDVNAIGYNGRIDILQTANHHRKEIDSLLSNSNHQHDKESMMVGEIKHLKEIVKNDKKNSDEEDERRTISRKALIMAAKNGKILKIKMDSISIQINNFYPTTLSLQQN